MDQQSPQIDSTSSGDPARHVSFDRLEREFEALKPAPRDAGRVALLVTRRDGGRREILDRISLVPDGGFPGDSWGRSSEPKREAQITVMQIEVAELIANGQPVTLLGDNLFVDLDLSAANLPIGSRVRIGGATMEVTPKPHNGCHKFQARFGADALRFISRPDVRPRNLRGIYLCVLESGEVAPGDPVRVLERAKY